MQRTLSRLDNCSICFSTCVELGLHNGLEQTCCTVLMYLIWLGWIISPVLMSICLFFSPGGQHGHMQPFSDEDASIETLSHCSSFSDTASVADEGKCVCVHLGMQIQLYFMCFSLCLNLGERVLAMMSVGVSAWASVSSLYTHHQKGMHYMPSVLLGFDWFAVKFLIGQTL